MNTKQKKAIQQLKNIKWPDGISLFSFSGTLCVVDDRTCEILDTIDIPNDGGAAGVKYTDDKEYLHLYAPED